MCLWISSGGLQLNVSVMHMSSPPSTVEAMRKSNGYTVQDPRLAELGAAVKGGPVVSAITTDVLVTLIVMGPTVDAELGVDLAIQILQYLRN
ncbi:hypothetical protein B2J88_04020 [Rhodococcus sp. SRB_17]|nr:hypothetical protein [Rhodococcus sp. SRB_17]